MFFLRRTNCGEAASEMAETIGAGVVLLLAVYGCVQGVRWAALRLLRPPRRTGGVWLLPLCGHCEDVEYLVRAAAARRRWNAEEAADVMVVDAGADEETRMLAQRVCDEVSGARFLRAEDLPEELMNAHR